MTSRSLDFMRLDRQLFARDIASALVEFLRQRGLTAKQAARRYDMDAATIANLPKGVCAMGTLLKIAIVEGRDLWEALGDEIYGETLDAYEERKLQAIIERTENAKRLSDERLARRRDLGARADALVALRDRASHSGRG
jgi:transcriptional regulator with XRE-family HTH domain